MCYRPIYLKARDAIVQCGKCPKCIARKVSAWSFRLLQEEKTATSSQFITVTYDTKHVPITSSGRMALDKPDLQKFFKRLRKSHSSDSKPIKYYAVGEYGGKTKRPHYHIILFNADIELINAAWNKGQIHYGQVSGASVGYTLKYMMKHKKNRNPEGLQKEFALMSKGLGISYLETHANWHAEHIIDRMFCTLEGGQKIAMPRYYKDKLYFDLERAAVAAVYEIQLHEIGLKKLSKQTTKTIWNEQQAIDAAFDKMYRSAEKTLV